MMNNSTIATRQLIWLSDVVVVIVVIWIIRLMCVITIHKKFIPKELLTVKLAVLAHLMLQPIVMLRHMDSLQFN